MIEAVCFLRMGQRLMHENDARDVSMTGCHGEIDALVLHEPLLRYHDASNCSTGIVEAIRRVQVQGLHAAFPDKLHVARCDRGLHVWQSDSSLTRTN